MQTWQSFACVLSSEIDARATAAAEARLVLEGAGPLPVSPNYPMRPGAFGLVGGAAVELLFSDYLVSMPPAGNGSLQTSWSVVQPADATAGGRARPQIAWAERLAAGLRRRGSLRSDVLFLNTGIHWADDGPQLCAHPPRPPPTALTAALPPPLPFPPLSPRPSSAQRC